MMKRLFVDTTGWMSMADRSDTIHAHAVRTRDDWLRQGAILVTSDDVIDETLTLIRIRPEIADRIKKRIWRTKVCLR